MASWILTKLDLAWTHMIYFWCNEDEVFLSGASNYLKQIRNFLLIAVMLACKDAMGWWHGSKDRERQTICSNLLLYVASIQNSVEFDGLSKQGITSVLLHHIVALTLYLSCCMRLLVAGREWNSIYPIFQTMYLFTLKELIEKGKGISLIKVVGLVCILSALVARRA